MYDYLLVGTGAAIGGIARFGLSKFISNNIPTLFPFGTLAVNVIGSFVIGIIIFYFTDRELISPETKLLLTTGFCGGFTTFSTFSLETMNLLNSSQSKYAILNILLNFILTLGAVILAFYISKFLKG